VLTILIPAYLIGRVVWVLVRKCWADARARRASQLLLTVSGARGANERTAGNGIPTADEVSEGGSSHLGQVARE
jgi:hypothetical protein